MSHRITPPRLPPRYILASRDGPSGREHWWWCSRCRSYGPIDQTEQRAIQGFNEHAANCIYDYGAQP